MLTSLMLILLFGVVANKLFSQFKIPGLLGMIMTGIALGPYGLNWIDGAILDNSSDIRMLALIVILLRAGLGLNKDTLNQVGTVALKMSSIPCLAEGFTVTLTAHYLFRLPFIEAGILGFTLAAVSPAVIVPSMLYLKENGLGTRKGVPVIILAGASVDDVFAITLFTTFLGLALRTGGPVAWQVALIPVQIVGGIGLGIIFGYLLYKLYYLKTIKLSDMERLSLMLTTALIIVVIGERFHLAGLLAVMTLGFIILEKTTGIAHKLETELNKIWFFAQIFLFVLIGAEVNIQTAGQAGTLGLLVIVVGLLARSMGVLISLQGSQLNWKEKMFCAIAYTPKATVQAAIGGIPLAMGVPSGPLILAIAVLAIVTTAPLGAIGIRLSAPKLLEKDHSEGMEDA